jgi:hypothetical protein
LINTDRATFRATEPLLEEPLQAGVVLGEARFDPHQRGAIGL